MAVELVRKKNTVTRIVFPLIDDDGDTVSGATNLDSEYVQYSDGGNPGSWSDCTNEATEIGSTGVYYLIMTASEVNADFIAVQIKSSGGTVAKTQHVVIRTFTTNPSLPDVADAVWDALFADHKDSGSFGLLVASLYRSEYNRQVVHYATGTVPAQGIDQDLVDTNRCVQYIKIDVSSSRNWGSPDLTYYLLFHYDGNGALDEVRADNDTTW